MFLVLIYTAFRHNLAKKKNMIARLILSNKIQVCCVQLSNKKVITFSVFMTFSLESDTHLHLKDIISSREHKLQRKEIRCSCMSLKHRCASNMLNNRNSQIQVSYLETPQK